LGISLCFQESAYGELSPGRFREISGMGGAFGIEGNGISQLPLLLRSYCGVK